MRVYMLMAAAALTMAGLCSSCGPLATQPAAIAADGARSAVSGAPAAGTGDLGRAAADDLARATPGRAILARGTYAFRGLPYFPPNAVPGLAGEYAFMPGAASAAPPGAASAQPPGAVLHLRVWYTRESLLFGDGWKRGSLGGYVGYELQPEAGGVIFLALVATGHELFFEFPSDSPALRSFALALETKFSQFFAQSADDTELSFPAYVDTHG
ncbi:MAG TPA: hypothetical protein VMC79_01885 [Rectinemataceae bacterium]|nr:hypothetical protein [Rectinemataceae bacterium]